MMNNHNLLIGRVFRKSSAILTITFSVLFISNIVDGVIISCLLGSGSMAAFQLVSPVLMNIVVAVAAFFIAPYAVRLLGLSPQENIIAVNAIRISLLTFPIRAVNGSIRKYFHGIGFMTITYIISFLEELVFICASAFVLSSYLGSLGVWIAYPVCEILTILFIAVCAAFRLIKFLPDTDEGEKFVDYVTESGAQRNCHRARAFHKR